MGKDFSEENSILAEKIQFDPFFSDHALVEMRKRQVTRRIVVEILRRGRIYKWNPDHEKGPTWTVGGVWDDYGYEVAIAGLYDDLLTVRVVTAHPSRKFRPTG